MVFQLSSAPLKGAVEHPKIKKRIDKRRIKKKKKKKKVWYYCCSVGHDAILKHASLAFLFF